MSDKIRVCPKCGTVNDAVKSSCDNCHEFIFEAPITQKAASPNMGPVGAALGGNIGYTPPPNEKKKISTLGILLAVLFTMSAGYGFWWFKVRTVPPEQVVQRFSDACDAKDFKTAASYVCKADIDLAGSKEAFAAALEKVSKNDKSTKATTGEVAYEDEITALVELNEEGPIGEQIKAQLGTNYKVQITAMLQDGQWKVDYSASSRQLAADLYERMPKAAPILPKTG